VGRAIVPAAAFSGGFGAAKQVGEIMKGITKSQSAKTFLDADVLNKWN
jgi:hypothetical protein